MCFPIKWTISEYFERVLSLGSCSKFLLLLHFSLLLYLTNLFWNLRAPSIFFFSFSMKEIMTIVLFWAIPVRNCDSICCFFYCVFNYVALMTRLLSSIIATIWQPKSLLILNRIPSNLPPANNWNSSENFVFFFFGEKIPIAIRQFLKYLSIFDMAETLSNSLTVSMYEAYLFQLFFTKITQTIKLSIV